MRLSQEVKIAIVVLVGRCFRGSSSIGSKLEDQEKTQLVNNQGPYEL